ncbi:DUF6089 family protein [Riemerella columbina]|uniref:type IX secretion system protein PorG n=1 Tax=Riemerella columbina TaxID=103810 RepID=UPI00037431EA|nr:DUF6089 family protein [Riemerella columbina]
MKAKLFSLLFLLFSLTFSFSQRHELGVQLGASNLVGDIGRNQYTLQKPLNLARISEFGVPFYMGVLYRMNFNPYQTIRFNLGWSNVQFNDSVSNENYRSKRGFFGVNTLYHAETLFEYNFAPINNEQKNPMLSPYIFAGLGAMLYSNTRHTLDYEDMPMVDIAGNFVIPQNKPKIEKEFGNELTLSVPFGVGLKYKFNYNWTVFGEFTFRPTFSDNLDYSNMTEKQVKVVYNKELVEAVRGSKKYLTKEEINQIVQPYVEANRVGNLQSKDWANSVTLGLSYSFGRPPCYCD